MTSVPIWARSKYPIASHDCSTLPNETPLPLPHLTCELTAAAHTYSHQTCSSALAAYTCWVATFSSSLPSLTSTGSNEVRVMSYKDTSAWQGDIGFWWVVFSTASVAYRERRQRCLSREARSCKRWSSPPPQALSRSLPFLLLFRAVISCQKTLSAFQK